MSQGNAREFWCTVVLEQVVIGLRRADGFGSQRGFFVQCNRTECQYVDKNELPCPLNVGMFAEEIWAAEAARAFRYG